MTNDSTYSRPVDRLQQWAAACSQCLGSIYDICRPFHEPDGKELSPQVRFVVAQLAVSCHLTSESALILLSHRKIWDADILLRTVVEGTFKYMYILNGTADQQHERCNEYWNVLPDIAVLNRQKRVRSLLDQVIDSASIEWDPIRELLVAEDEIRRILAETDKKERQRLGHAWSFSDIAKYFATHPDGKYHGLGCLAYNYGMQSHTVHQDGDGVGMLWERAGRSPERRESVELAHGGRIISDLCHFAFFRAREIFSACRASPKGLRDIQDFHEPLFASVNEAKIKWNAIEYRGRLQQQSSRRGKE